MSPANIPAQHCAPEDIEALLCRLESLADPAQEAVPSYEDTDWRSLASVCARVIKHLRGDDWIEEWKEREQTPAAYNDGNGGLRWYR